MPRSSFVIGRLTRAGSRARRPSASSPRRSARSARSRARGRRRRQHVGRLARSRACRASRAVSRGRPRPLRDRGVVVVRVANDLRARRPVRVFDHHAQPAQLCDRRIGWGSSLRAPRHDLTTFQPVGRSPAFDLRITRNAKRRALLLEVAGAGTRNAARVSRRADRRARCAVHAGRSTHRPHSPARRRRPSLR